MKSKSEEDKKKEEEEERNQNKKKSKVYELFPARTKRRNKTNTKRCAACRVPMPSTSKPNKKHAIDYFFEAINFRVDSITVINQS